MLASLVGFAAYVLGGRASAFLFVGSTATIFVDLIACGVTPLDGKGRVLAVLVVLAGLAVLIGATLGSVGRGRLSSLSLAACGFVIWFIVTAAAAKIFIDNFNLGFGG